MTAGWVSAASETTLGVFVKSLVANKTPDDHAMLHIHVSIGGKGLGQCDSTLTSDNSHQLAVSV